MNSSRPGRVLRLVAEILGSEQGTPAMSLLESARRGALLRDGTQRKMAGTGAAIMVADGLDRASACCLSVSSCLSAWERAQIVDDL